MEPWKVTLRLCAADFLGGSTEGDTESKQSVLVCWGVTAHKLRTQAIMSV